MRAFTALVALVLSVVLLKTDGPGQQALQLAVNSLKVAGQLFSGTWPPVIDGVPLWGTSGMNGPPSGGNEDRAEDGDLHEVTSPEVMQAESPRGPQPGERVFTVDELAMFSGTPNEINPDGRILMGVGGIVWDVTELGAMFYGPGQHYSCFAARPSSRALSLGSLEKDDIELGDMVEDFDEQQLKALRGQVAFYENKYVRAGVLSDRDLMIELGFR